MPKTYDYIIVLQRKSYAMVDNVSKLMLLLAMAAFLFYAYSTFQLHNTKLSGSGAWLLVSVSSSIVGWWGYCAYQEKRGLVPYYRFGIMFCAWGWFTVPSGVWIGMVYIVACLLEKPVKVPPEVAFDAFEIVFNSFPKKKYTWQETSNVVLKDGLLTIDLKNNTLIQRPLDTDVSIEIENEFNSFCKAMIESKS